MKKTLDLAEKALEQEELPIAALVVFEGNIISQSIALDKKENRFLVHAELLALEAADKILKPLPEIRRKTALFTNLEPCLMCMGAAMSFCIGEIYYSLESPEDGAIRLVRQMGNKTDVFSEYRIPNIKGGICGNTAFSFFTSMPH